LIVAIPDALELQVPPLTESVKVVVVPEQIGEVPVITEGNGLTVTLTVSVLTQPAALVPRTVYKVVLAGEATGEVQLVQESPVPGDHVYVAAPVPVSVVELPAQIETFAPPSTVGNGETTIV
jgi:hypothetical protein